MLTVQYRSMLKSIFLNFGIYLKQNLRLFFKVILYRSQTGCPWRDLPKYFDNPNSIFKKFSRWSKQSELYKNILTYNEYLLMQYLPELIST